MPLREFRTDGEDLAFRDPSGGLAMDGGRCGSLGQGTLCRRTGVTRGYQAAEAIAGALRIVLADLKPLPVNLVHAGRGLMQDAQLPRFRCAPRLRAALA